MGRDSNGVPTADQNLGTAAIPWGTLRANAIVLNGTAVDTSKITSPVNRVISGKTRSTSNQPAFITPNGAALSFQVKAASTSLVVDINGTAVTVSADLTKSSLTAAPSSQNTCLVNDTDASGQHDTRLWGEPEHRKKIIIDTVGTNISNLIGKFAAFKIGSEYFLALVEDSTHLSHCRRGYFYDSSLLPTNRSTFSNNDTITLMKLGWIFLDVDAATIDVTYNNPTWSQSSPSGPSTGDYWYDLANKQWKRYDGASFVVINRVLIGNFVNDTTNCVAARCVDFYADYRPDNDIHAQVSTTEIAIGSMPYMNVSVAGNLIAFGNTLPTWNITTQLATGSSDLYDETEQASRMYYLYVKDTGALVMSDISPYFRRDLYGEYHPHNPWRCVGLAYNSSGSNIVQAGGITPRQFDETQLSGYTSFGAVATKIFRFTTTDSKVGGTMVYEDDANAANRFTCYWPGVWNFFVYVSDGAAVQYGGSINSADLTQNIVDEPSVTSVIACRTGNVAGGDIESSSAAKRLYIGDVFRFQGSGSGSAPSDIRGRVTRVSL